MKSLIICISVFLFVFSVKVQSQVYDLMLHDMSITTYTEPFVAKNSITASDFTVTGDGDVTFKAGNVITLLPGFSVTQGGEFHAYIAEVNNDEKFPDGDLADNNGNILYNFPNPFSLKTTVYFKISVPGKVKISVMNSTGQTVSVLVDKIFQEQAGQKIIFDATGLPGGIYYYKLETEDNVLIKKMIVSK